MSGNFQPPELEGFTNVGQDCRQKQLADLSAFYQGLDERANACQGKPIGVLLGEVPCQEATVEQQ